MSEAPPRPLQVGDTGPEVGELQARLLRLGYGPLRIDDRYGDATAAAVREFQKNSKIAADGVVGERTWRLLSGGEPATVEAEATESAVAGSGSVPDEPEAAEGLVASDTLESEVLSSAVPEAAVKARGTRAPRQPPTEQAAPTQPLEQAAQAAQAAQAKHAPQPDQAAPADEPRPPEPERRPWFAGYTSDRSVTADALGRVRQADLLCSVLTAKNLETPLAVGLFGDWGSGKSFFMRMLQERITKLSESSARREKDAHETYYCSHVVQVTFNAWLHVDADMWPSLASKVFRAVAGIDEDVAAGSTQRDDLAEYQRTREGDYQARRASQREDVALRAEIARLDADLAKHTAALGERLTSLGPTGAGAVEVVTGVAEARDRLRGLREVWRHLRKRDVALLLGLLVVAVASAVVAMNPDLRAAWAAFALAFVGAVALLRPVARVMLDAVRLVDLRARRRALDEQARAARQRAEARPVDDPGPLLREYVEEQAGRWAERSHAGDLTEIRRAFERLSRLVDERRKASTAARSADGAGTLPPIDRVVVYIDDLDRCPPQKVLEVLSAINLLLDIPNFVVVVGVDSRWLFRSLEARFAQLMADGAAPVSPQQYLEKIFQYSIVLPRVDEEGFARLVDRLLPVARGGRNDDVPVGGFAEPVAAVTHPEVTEEDLRPRDLVVTEAEMAGLRELAPWFETPRAVKRLTNVYRLIRVSVGEDRLLTDDAYRKVLVLLGLAIAYPATAGEVFARLGSPKPFGEVLYRRADETARPGIPNLPGSGALGMGDPSESFEDWAELVAAFSFHPWRR